MSFLLPPLLPTLDSALHDAAQGTPDSRWVAALALGMESGARSREALDALDALLGDPCEEVRAQALEGILEQAERGAPVPESSVLHALDDSAPAVRCAAVDAALAILENPEPSVLALAADPDVSVRLAACRAIGCLAAQSGIGMLSERLADSHALVQLAAAVALAEMGIGLGEAVLMAALTWEPREASDAMRALGLLASTAAVPHLENIVGKFWASAELKAMAGAALARCSAGKSGTNVIAKMLADRSANKKLLALTTLARLPISGLVREVGSLIADKDPLIVSSAIHTLVELAAIEPAAALAELISKRGTLHAQLAEELEECLETIGEKRCTS